MPCAVAVIKDRCEILPLPKEYVINLHYRAWGFPKGGEWDHL